TGLSVYHVLRSPLVCRAPTAQESCDLPESPPIVATLIVAEQRERLSGISVLPLRGRRNGMDADGSSPIVASISVGLPETAATPICRSGRSGFRVCENDRGSISRAE